MDHYLPAVHRALAVIEEKLTQPVTLEEISRRAGFSLWHFQRIFAAYVGEPLGCHLRRRRLTAAADELRTGRRRILAIALDHQFETHAAFTRAFVAVLGTTPTEFRRTGKLSRFQARPLLFTDDLRHRFRNVIMQPKIHLLPALTLLGVEGRFIGPMSPDANNTTVIPRLYGRFFARQAELPPPLDGFIYGACRCLPPRERSREDELVYLVSVSVPPGSPVPKGLKIWQVPELTCALFRHRGPIARIGDTYNYIFGTWLPRSDYDLADGPNIERSDESFGDGGENSEFDILIPVQPRKKPAAPKPG